MSKTIISQCKQLSEMVIINNGIDYKKNPKGNKEIPIYGTGGIMGYTSIPLNEGPAVLSGRKGSINRPFYVEGKFWNVDTIFCLKPLFDNDAKWLYYSLLNTDMTKLNEATGVPSVTSKSLYRLKINYFPPVKQRQIAKILTTCDAVIEQTEAVIAKYKAIKQGMLHDLFTRGLDANGKLRPTFQQAPELYKASELGMIPKEWDVKTIMELTNGSNYSIVDGPFGSNLKSIHYKSQGIPIIQSGFVTKNIFNADSYLYVDNEKFQSEIRSKVVGGDIIMAKIGAQCGTCALLPVDHQDAIIAGNCLKITIDKCNSNSFYERYFHYMYTIGTISKIILTTAQPAVSMSSLKKLKVIYPQHEEQSNISLKIKSIDDKLHSEDTLLSKYQSIKRGLMADLLSGKKEVE